MSSGRSHSHHGLAYVYRIRSIADPARDYIGVTRNVKARLSLHNSGKVEETKDAAPWELEFYAAFPSRHRAKSFAHFLKTESGQVFGRHHLWEDRSL